MELFSVHQGGPDGAALAAGGNAMVKVWYDNAYDIMIYLSFFIGPDCIWPKIDLSTFFEMYFSSSK
jgi:hypothetical protein